MPLYDYECQECGHVFEDMSSFESRSADRECPKCKKICQCAYIITKAPSLTDSVSLGRQKAPGDFRNFLNDIKKKTPGNNMKDF